MRGDRGRLKQVIVNLLDNAIKFTPRGGSVESDAPGSSDGFAVLEVRDSGIGIPPAALPRVFERFYRVDEARSREDGGAGLGLSIVRSICSAHGARNQKSTAQRRASGSCFRLRSLEICQPCVSLTRRATVRDWRRLRTDACRWSASCCSAPTRSRRC